MARAADRTARNVPGDFFVDDTCIDCGLCRQLAPATFGDAEQSFVKAQPSDPEQLQRALMALVTCPTASIGSEQKHSVKAALASFPEQVEENVYFCGFASADSYGASSYLIVRPEGNILIDSPRAAAPLLRRLEALGGVRHMFLTHRDDVADHEVFRERFGCERILHSRDVSSGTRAVERIVSGDDPIALAPDLLAIPVPGHTRGSMALLHRDRFLFSGDHVWWEEGRGLHASRGVCWYSWEEQRQSVARLLNHRFEWVLPGHGRRFHASDAGEMGNAVRALVERIARA